ncbi:MAG: nuclear transport factor 2 family protein [Myxococcota bacterium]|nr:nuclear transport factor 2 family protein [Myxococcota bacterium]
MGTDENKKFARAFIDAISRGDAQAIQDAYAEDGSSWTIGSMPISGRFSKAEIAQTASSVLDVFPEGLTFTVHSMTAEDDRVAIEAESKGIHVSGKEYNNLYHFLMRVRDGKIVEWKEYMDTMHANDVLCGGS